MMRSAKRLGVFIRRFGQDMFRSPGGSGAPVLRRGRYAVPLSVALAGVVAVGLIAIAWATSRGATVAGIACEQPVWDIGRVDVGETSPTLTHRFRLRNAKSSRVSIAKVQSSCGCLIANDYARVLDPGGVTDLAVSITLPPRAGPFRKTIAVGLGENSGDWLVLEVVAEIATSQGLACAPALVNFGRVGKGDVERRVVRILRFVECDLSRVVLTTSSTAMAATWAEAGGFAEDSPSLVITLDSSSLPIGPYRGNVLLKSEGNQSLAFSIPVSGEIVERHSSELAVAPGDTASLTEVVCA